MSCCWQCRAVPPSRRQDKLDGTCDAAGVALVELLGDAVACAGGL